ncbi:MAG: glucose/quinate/shikimate family membrane-bound PQQ-dependent dehydrogenase [Halioglobus sp.]
MPAHKPLATLLALTLVALLPGCKTAVVEAPAAGQRADWPAYGATPGGTHFSRASQITPDNVAQLEVAWQHRSGDMREGRHDDESFFSQSSMQVTPIVIGDRLYYCSPFNRVFALQAETGEEIWSFDPGVNMDEVPVLPNCRGVSSWQSGREGVCEHRILFGTFDARLIALDAETGRRCTDFGDNGEVDTAQSLGTHRTEEYGITSPPAIFGDSLITGSMVLDNQRTDSPGGIVRAYDVRSGELQWVFNPVPPGMPERNADGTWLSGTTNVWSIIAVDEELGLVYLPTGNTTPDYFGGHRRGPGEDGERFGLDYYSSSVVALYAATGEVAWHFQMVHHDIWDFDTPAQPTLVDLTVDGERVPALVQVTKMGLTFVLNRETGEPVWPVEERPVPQAGKVPEEYLSPTQPFPTHVPPLVGHRLTREDAWGLTPWDRNRCADLIETMNHEGRYTPPSTAGSINFPANAGGNNWGSPAIDPDTGVMVAFTNRVPGYVKLIPRDQCEGNPQPQLGTPYCLESSFLRSPLGLPCTAPPWGTLDAIDLASGKHLWSVPLGTTRYMAPFPFWWLKGLPGLGAPMMTDTGLVFSGVSNDHTLRAFDALSGDPLWQAKLPTAGNALPMTYQVRPDGRQFVVIAAGGHWSGGAPPGDYLIAFALPLTE